MPSPIELARQVVFPQLRTSDRGRFSRRLRGAAKSLRHAYFSSCPQRDEVYSVPFGGPITDSIGPWPEFILRGTLCRRSAQGCCTPCFYSRLPIVARPREEIQESLVAQARYVVGNFDRLVVRNQHGGVSWPRVRNTETSPIALVLTPTGSFFDEEEFPHTTRVRILRTLAEHSRKIGRPLALHVETHADDVHKAAELPAEFAETMELLRDLGGRVILGLESSNDVVRNVLYNKVLNIARFHEAVDLIRKNGLGIGAFVFSGITPLSDVEMLADAVGTLEFLHEHSVSPVVMFHNVQPYTIQELLHVYHVHRLPEPRTVLEVIRHVGHSIPDLKDAPMDSWLVADPVGGPPPPKYNIFSAQNMVTCSSCAASIYDALVAFRRSRNVDAFMERYDELGRCQCAERYQALLEGQLLEVTALSKRIEQTIALVDEKMKDYVETVRPMMNESEGFAVFADGVTETVASEPSGRSLSRLKADLLCLGLRIDNAVEREALEYNSYVKEGGFVHAAHFLVGDHLVNACVAEGFCASSPYVLTSRDGEFQLWDADGYVAGCRMLPLPEWCREHIGGRLMGDILRPHNTNVISGMPNARCSFFSEGRECAFCTLGPLQSNEPVPAEAVAEAALRALEHNPAYELALSGGTPDSPDRGVSYFGTVIRAIRARSGMPVSVEMVPPDDDSYIDELHDAGATSLIMNLEIWDQRLRSIFCPGKSAIARERYLAAIEHAVEVFGKGQVASVVIAGLQSKSMVVEGARAIVDRGGVPTVIPFRPFDDCALSGLPTTSPADVVETNHSVQQLLSTAGLDPCAQSGCTGCGGCSLENLWVEG